ncbi:metalloregulator ArsR/SmtB family transcription factor [Cytobacillus sp. S13-E01]|uniref:ArsR/SmtB family transcription factor n=1 Tax=Cytobacillus sp. S13-E01 TaxID=3031326 RepID=UPI0023D7D5CD|nr:metalloregulator ArsR/SmtB family transcription factor [Cytobacillus sp. S13-E01]MDF0726837.1 metalloregulator ArsR/SmtB family transcription factor [Cytobacillus sp. S13-E01]
MKEIELTDVSFEKTFAKYELKFKALADKKRLRIMNEIVKRGSVCVCDLSDIVDMPQSKLSYHLRILFDADLLIKVTKGTWSYYELNEREVNHLLSEELCCLFRPDASSKSYC